jgi:hypothetical protein
VTARRLSAAHHHSSSGFLEQTATGSPKSTERRGTIHVVSASQLSEIRFSVGPWARSGVLLTPIIDGRSLVDLVTDYEEAKDWELAGIHDGLVLDESELSELPKHLLHGKPSSPHDRGIAVLGCTCGVNDCLPFLAEIRVTDDEVWWGEFRYPLAAGLPWDYSGFGPFVFDRDQYETALDKVLGTALGLMASEH